ncbi:MAG: ATP-binding protein [Thermodesulfobacteriota bacterium]|nr:ATP-binding protein [Thermodesulfobacteriota bacterium]
MKHYQYWLDKLLPSPLTESNTGVVKKRDYKYFSRGLALILLVLVLAPLTLISVVSHHQYKHLLQEEEMTQLILNLETGKNTIEEFVSELQSIVKFVARDDRYQEVLNPEELEALFIRLQKEYPGFADIEIIDAEGSQKAYFGPYQLEDQNYTDQIWYKEVLLRGVYISNIFSGFRHVPHFVIAVSRKHPDKPGHWVLRVTIEGSTLQNFINTISSSYADDMFLVDSECIVQTQPQKYGKIGEKCILLLMEDTAEHCISNSKLEKNTTGKESADLMIVKRTFQGQEITHAVVDLIGTPWKLVLIKEQYLYANTWLQFKIKLATIFLTCVIIAVLIIFEISSAITKHLRESDKKRQQLYSEAEHSNKLASIGRLAAGVAHEINNPLSIINQKTGLVQDIVEMSDDFEHKTLMVDAHESIQNSVNRCKKITHRLLGFARQTDVQVEEIDINATVKEVVEFLEKEALYNQIEIAFDLDQSVSKIVSDRGPLQQVFLNITNNAIDAIGSHGKITLSSRQVDQKHIQIKIQDNGPGMPAKVLKRIFEPFFTTKETGKGTGLGLSITYGLVKKLGGDIKVTSEVGEGTLFQITLPTQHGE